MTVNATIRDLLFSWKHIAIIRIAINMLNKHFKIKIAYSIKHFCILRVLNCYCHYGSYSIRLENLKSEMVYTTRGKCSIYWTSRVGVFFMKKSFFARRLCRRLVCIIQEIVSAERSK